MPVLAAAAGGPPAPPPGQPAPTPELKFPVRLDTLPITPHVTLLRATCSSSLPEIQFGQRLGTTTNSYLISGSPKGAAEVLIDVPSKVYDYNLADWVKELGALSTIKTLVITRLNPERIEPLKKVLAALPGSGIRLIASNVALQFIKERAETDADLRNFIESGKVLPEAVTRSAEVKLSSGKLLKFIPVPTPRWPDLCAAYFPEDELLFSSSFFAAHEAFAEGAGAFDEGGWDVHGPAWKYYFECMLAPAAKQVAIALDRLRINATEARSTGGPFDGLLSAMRSVTSFVNEITLGADDGTLEPLRVGILCPIHGPLIKSSLTELVRRYADWTAEQVEAANKASVAVLYASAYGNTAALAQAISRGITKAGVGVETLNLEVVGINEVEKVLQTSAGFIIGSPTLGGHMPTQVQTALGAILKAGGDVKMLPCGVFGSFGWSGEAVDKMEGRLKDAGFQFAFPAIRCKFKPTESTLQICEESGTDLAQAIRKMSKRKEKVVSQKLGAAENASPSALAVGRIIGSLCVLTAKEGDAQSAMLASWVSQASFDPPGLTISVKKDRAVESLLPLGSKFVLNVLAEGREKASMKAMLKPFAPGEDRFAGLDVQISEATEAVILPDSCAYLECAVTQRMEAGDHWLVYATVNGGKVLDDGVQSAVHYRKTGTSY
jgi:flavorubredoxin/flavin reductase (DIM6/NTAB) family NADH-FMN oxidoreductase RutF